jgi:hypothetical protein
MSVILWAPIVINIGTLGLTGLAILLTKHKIVELHMTLNSRLDQLIELSRLKGQEEGRVAEVERKKDA